MASPAAGPVVNSTLVAPHHELKQPYAPAEMPSLPNGFPAVLSSPLAWTGQQFARQSDYIHHLDADEIREIDAALKYFKGESRLPLTLLVRYHCSRPCILTE